MDKRISASEVNRFTYCAYQWYYERVYGQKEIQALRRELMREWGGADSAKSNFNKGNAFHESYMARYTARRGRRSIPAAVVAAAAAVMLILLIIWIKSQYV